MSLIDKIKEIKQEEQEAIRKRNIRLEECRRTIMEDQMFKKIEIAGIHKDNDKSSAYIELCDKLLEYQKEFCDKEESLW